MEYLRNMPSIYNLDGVSREVWKLNKDELIRLYTSCTRHFLQHASDRNSYREGVNILRKLIKYGGKVEADEIIADQKNRKPHRPALLDELSQL